ncbi:MAG TPA: HRDC domain-containing protein [Woeseiaceae bacterium]|nr:HRDC domain-containing protein [Woeseiaceae bacterium]
MPEFEYIAPQSFDRLSERIAAEKLLGVDTEFMRETTFYPELCLLQLATPDRIFCADPLGLSETEIDVAGFWQTLADRRWVVHSARQDMEVLYLTAGLLPREIFDTQVAAALLGYAPQLGYAAMVAELFGVVLAKSHTRADWRRRPLPREFLEYAAEDVEHLLPACEVLSERLSKRGRLEWARQDSMDLLDNALYGADPAAAIDRLKGARNLRGRARRAAEALAAWREREALRLDRPRQWILKDAALLDLAMANPANAADLSRIPGLPPKIVKRSGNELAALVAAARTGTDDYEPPARPDEAAKAVLKEMQGRVAAAAARLEIVPEVLAPRKELSEALTGARDLRVFRGWRREVIGQELLGLL